MSRTFVGIGFGAIQTGLFLREAQSSGNFDRYVIAMRRATLADEVNATGSVAVNTAMPDGIKVETYGNVVARCLQDAEDLERLKQDLIDAHEISVAVSSVKDYVSESPNSLHLLLAEAILVKMESSAPKALIYSSENHNEAAELLEQAILSAIPADQHATARKYFQTVDTVIGKMSRIITSRDEIEAAGLTTSSPAGSQAFLVEAFNHILISQVDPQRTSGRGITQLVEKANLVPFEHAKIHGHNATHAGFAYVGQLLGLEWMADVAAIPEIRAFFRTAFIEESGAALIDMYGGQDPLFSPKGFEQFVDDLLERMANPWLRDTCERIGRDVPRKLGWDDRLIGTIRLVQDQGIDAHRFGYAALAGFNVLGQSPNSLIYGWIAAGATPEKATQMADWLNQLQPAYEAWRDHLLSLPIPSQNPPQD